MTSSKGARAGSGTVSVTRGAQRRSARKQAAGTLAATAHEPGSPGTDLSAASVRRRLEGLPAGFTDRFFEVPWPADLPEIIGPPASTK